MDSTPGPVVLFGSGETSPSGRKVFDRLLKNLPQPPRLALLETPSGFELNSEQVIGRVAEFIAHRLQNYQPKVTVVPARKRGTAFSPDDPQVVAPLLDADLIFMGPGSPSYAVRQLRDSLAWQYLTARQRLGATLVLASAAAIAISAYALPVYEIYKVGEDPHWKPGLNFFGPYGLSVVFIPHWNNEDGGEELDTSRCFMGQARFAQLMEMLPLNHTVLGIDEKTALVFDLPADLGRVIGLGRVTLIHAGHHHRGEGDPSLRGSGLDEIVARRQGHVHQYRDGQTFSLSECCPLEPPPPTNGLARETWNLAVKIQQQRQVQPTASPVNAKPPASVLVLVELRQAARAERDWAAADRLREQIADLGWVVVDTPGGARLERKSD